MGGDLLSSGFRAGPLEGGRGGKGEGEAQQGRAQFAGCSPPGRNRDRQTATAGFHQREARFAGGVSLSSSRAELRLSDPPTRRGKGDGRRRWPLSPASQTRGHDDRTLQLGRMLGGQPDVRVHLPGPSPELTQLVQQFLDPAVEKLRAVVGVTWPPIMGFRIVSQQPTIRDLWCVRRCTGRASSRAGHRAQHPARGVDDQAGQVVDVGRRRLTIEFPPHRCDAPPAPRALRGRRHGRCRSARRRSNQTRLILAR